MNRWLKRTLILAVVVVIIVGLRLTVFRAAPVPVAVYRVDRGQVEATVVNSRAGTVKSRFRARMSPGIAGLVAEIPAQKGKRVEKGQVLLKLDAREFEAQVALAARSLEAARAVAEEARLAADQAARDFDRARELAARNHLSEQGLEKAGTAAESAAAGRVAASEMANTTIVAPFDGVVLDVTTEVGEWISPSPPGVFIPPVIDLIDPATLYVEAPLDEADVGRITVGLPVRITMDAFRDETFAGRLTYASSFVETRLEQNRTLTVEAVFEVEDLPVNVLAGLSADLEVILDSRANVLRIPTYALLEGNRVLVAREGELHSVAVETGLNNWQYTEITAGLAADDQVVVSLDRPEVEEGVKVEITEEVQR